MRALRFNLIVGLLGLSATALAAQKITITPASPINCGAPPANQTNTIVVNVNNTGDANLSVTAVTSPAAPFGINGVPGLPISIPPGAGFSFNLTFTPTVQGSFNSSFTVSSNDPNTPNTVLMVTGSSGNPMITLDTQTVIFPNTRVGAVSAPPNVINIKNTGLGDLKVTGLVMGGANPNDFKVMSPMLPFTIAPNATTPIQVTFTPTALGARTGTLTIQNNDGNAPNKQVNLQGNATQAVLSAAPGMLDFGTQQEFLASSPKQVVSTNAGNGDAFIKAVTFTGANPMSFALSAPPPFPAKVAANNGSVTLNVVAVPLVSGSNTATMHIQYDDPMKAEDTVNVTVSGVAGSVALDNAYLDFGAVPINPNPAPSKTVTITNKGNNDLLITNAVIDDPQMTNAFDSMKADMLQQNMGFPVTIKPGAKYTFDVVFTPQVAMQFQASLNLDFMGDPMAKFVHIPLAGIGTMAGLTVTPQMLSFPATPVGSIGGPQAVTLTNSGGTSLNVQSIVLGGTTPQAYQIDNPGNFMLDPGKTATVNVTFTPLAGGAAMANLTITVMGLTPINVKLNGTGTTPMLGVAPNSVDFGMVAVGTPSDPAVIGMKNGGQADIKFSTISSSDAAFQVNTSTTAMTLKPGATTTFQVTFVPPATGTKSGVITISVQGQTNPLMMVPVMGTGIQAPKRAAQGCSIGGDTNTLPLGVVLLFGGLALVVAAPRVRRALRRR